MTASPTSLVIIEPVSTDLRQKVEGIMAVSYTHLTLPTILLV